MSRYSRSPTLTRHRSGAVAEDENQPQVAGETLSSTLTASSPPGKLSDGLQDFGSSKNRMHLRKSCKASLIPVLILTAFFILEWGYLSSLDPGRSPSESSGNSTRPSLKLKRSDRSWTPMLEHLLGLAAHALAQGHFKPEPDELWKEPISDSSKWRPCADSRPATHAGPPKPRRSSGYIVISAEGGLNQQRVAICNAVAIARLLNATLVLPIFLVSNVWRDTSQFADIYEEEYFVNYLKEDVHIVPELPLELQSLDLMVMGSVLTNIEVPKESKPSFFVDFVLPTLLRNRVVHFYGFENALSFDPVPFEIQRLRCRCNYHALKFKPHIRETAGKLIRRLRENSHRWGPIDNSLPSERRMSPIEEELVGNISGYSSRQIGVQFQTDNDPTENKDDGFIKYLGLHLRFEIDMVAYSLCDFGGGEAERQELAEYRKVHFPTVSKFVETGKMLTPAQRRANGHCPLTPEEGVLMLASLGFKRSTRIFLAGAHIYGGQARMAPIANLYPNIVTKEDLLTTEELAPFVNHSSQMAALDFIGCAVADAFAMTDSGSQLSSLASGFRIYHGHGRLPTIRPNKRRLAMIFTKNMTIEWEELEETVRKTVRDSKRLQVRPIARSIYRHPRCKECMCH